MAAAADVDRVPELELELGFGNFWWRSSHGVGGIYRHRVLAEGSRVCRDFLGTESCPVRSQSVEQVAGRKKEKKGKKMNGPAGAKKKETGPALAAHVW